MKKLAITFLITLGLASSLWAHHPSPSNNAGGNMSSSSGHLNIDLVVGM